MIKQERGSRGLHYKLSKNGVQTVKDVKGGKRSIAEGEIIYGRPTSRSPLPASIRLSSNVQNHVTLSQRTYCTWLRAVIGHITGLSVLFRLPNKKELTVAKAIVERVFGIFGMPEVLILDMGTEFEKQVCSPAAGGVRFKENPNNTLPSKSMHFTLHNKTTGRNSYRLSS